MHARKWNMEVVYWMVKDFSLCRHGIGIGGWLTNYKRFYFIEDAKKLDITIGDLEHFERFITKDDIAYIAESGFDHVRLAFDQVVVEEKDKPFVYRKQVLDIIDNFISWCDENNLGIVLNLHKALGSSGIPQIDFFKGRLEIFHGIGEEMLSRCTFQALITYF